jgi:hypothetical protein
MNKTRRGYRKDEANLKCNEAPHGGNPGIAFDAMRGGRSLVVYG